MSGARARHDAQVRAAQCDAAAVASGAITPGDVVELRSGTIDCQGLKIEPLPDGEQRAAFAKTLTLQQESQERAAAPNLQLPASSGSYDGAGEVPGAYKRAFEELQHECQRLDTARIEAERGFAEAASDLGGAESEVTDLKRQLADARQLYANRDAADEEMAAWQRETLAKAAAQFRAITGDFPGLTGPLVDLFKDVK